MILFSRGDFMRFQINVGDALQDKIDKYAEMCGVTRSSFCAMLISQGILAYEKSFEVIDSLKDTMPEKLKEIIDKDIKLD